MLKQFFIKRLVLKYFKNFFMQKEMVSVEKSDQHKQTIMSFYIKFYYFKTVKHFTNSKKICKTI